MRYGRRLVLVLTAAAMGSIAVAAVPQAFQNGSVPEARTPAPAPKPGAGGVDLSRLAQIDRVVADAIAEKKLPGAVVLIGHGDSVVFTKAYGDRTLVPAREAMTTDTIFDMASVTKVVATTTSVMTLVEDGHIRLTDPVAQFIPEFAKYGKDRVTVRHLLTHTSGLRPDLDQGDNWIGHDTAIKLACEEVLTQPPGRKFVYSDINFILLAEIVERVSKQPLDVYAQQHIFRPLGMVDSGFKPAASLRPRIAPTEACASAGGPCDQATNGMLRGVVHDPTSRRMGGVAGHAGLFSTAADLAIFCRMLLDGGAVNGARVLAPLTIARMTSPATAQGEPNVRGFGWDLDSSYSANRGEFMPLGSFGHTGFTGTSLWLDPTTKTFIVFLSNRVHPDGKGDVTPLRARIATIVASALTDVPSETARSAAWSRQTFDSQVPAVAPVADAPVLTGIDVLRASGFAALKGMRIGLVTNHTGLARDGQTTIDLLSKAPGVTLVSLFSPEHGIRGIVDAAVPSVKDEKTGLPINSLFGATERPTAAMLEGLDAIVVDLQDIGARFYTYPTTMAYVMEAAAPRKIKVFVLDRPNPIGGVAIDGPALDASATSFVGYLAGMPIRHGMTLGELAKLINAEKKINADLTVIAMKNWRRDEWYDETGLSWINPSPNMRNLYEAALYPGVGMIEYANISVGRGTDTPFEQIGAPWINGRDLADTLNARHLPGLRFYPVSFLPTAAKFVNERCEGVFIVVTDRNLVRASRLGAELASALTKMAPDNFLMDTNLKLMGSASDIAKIKAGDDAGAIASAWASAEAKWRLLRAKYLIYF